MSIGVEKVNGGIVTGQWTEGELYYFRVTGPAGAFAGSFSSNATGNKPVPDGGAAEAIYKILAQYGTPVIFEIVSATQVDVAMAYGSGVAASTLQTDVQALGSASYKKYGGSSVIGDDATLADVTLNFGSATAAAGSFQVADL